MLKAYPQEVKIVEVGPRDGLQNEATHIATADKLAYIEKLVLAGHRDIEVTSFVSPRAVPQMADAVDIVQALTPLPGVRFHALVPNFRGLERALEAGIRRIVVFTAASDGFAQKNINMTVERSLDVFRPVVRDALAAGASVRGYLSTCFVCPYEGEIHKERVLAVTESLFDMGVDEVAISDTIGAAAPSDVFRTVGFVTGRVPARKLALHFHDTYGTALANVLAGLELGITTFDASSGGIGGCPFAPGATGNLASEDLVYMLHRMGIATGVDLDKLADASRHIARVLGRELPSRNLQRLNASRGRE